MELVDLTRDGKRPGGFTLNLVQRPKPCMWCDSYWHLFFLPLRHFVHLSQLY